MIKRFEDEYVKSHKFEIVNKGKEDFKCIRCGGRGKNYIDLRRDDGLLVRVGKRCADHLLIHTHFLKLDENDGVIETEYGPTESYTSLNRRMRAEYWKIHYFNEFLGFLLGFTKKTTKECQELQKVLDSFADFLEVEFPSYG